MSENTPAASEYHARIERWADRLATLTLTDDQARGYACVACGHDMVRGPEPRAFVVVGYGKAGESSHLFACDVCDLETVRVDPEVAELAAMVAARIAVAVAKSGVLPGQLADEIGISPDELRARLDGAAEWGVVDVILLAEALGVEPSSFFGEEAHE